MIITENNKTNVYYVTFWIQNKSSDTGYIMSLPISLYDIVDETPIELTDGQFVVNLQRYLEDHFNNNCFISIINYWFWKS